MQSQLISAFTRKSLLRCASYAAARSSRSCFLARPVARAAAYSSSSAVVVDDHHDDSSSPWGRMNETTRALVQDLETTSNVVNQLETDPWKRRRALAAAITLVESTNPSQREQAALLLTHLLQQGKATNGCFRIGIAGAPGAGKSTFIEAFGRYVLDLSEQQTSSDEKNKPTTTNNDNTPWIPSRLAVVCIDPSSSLTGGSILGDKTRMVELSRHPRAFVRPAPASGTLGGLAPHTDDVLRLASAADYQLSLVETVGLGQSEIEIRQSVDMLLLLVPPAGGDDLQGVKKGIVEVADLLVVTKADGNLLPAARVTAADYKAAMPFVHHTKSLLEGESGGGPTPVMLASSVTGDGLDKIWEYISRVRQDLMKDGRYLQTRQEQNRYWMWKNLRLLVEEETRKNPVLQEKADELMRGLNEGITPPRVAASELLHTLKTFKE